MGKRKTLRNISLIILLVAAVGIGFYFTKSNNVEIAQTESLDIKFNKQGTLSFLSNDSVISTVDIEVANNDHLRARGLMYRKSLPMDASMLFVFDVEDYQGFWMRNTYIALDILFVDASKKIVTIHYNTTPMSEQNYASTEPALYVVEVNSGYCKQNNIKVGDYIEFEY